MSALFQFLLRQGDNTLVLGHRISEWCGVAPALEEDIALANTALDLIGQTQLWLGYAAEVENKQRTSDQLAFLRDAHDFRNLLLLETPNRDFGNTLMRQFLFDAFQVPFLKALENSSDQRIADIAVKSGKEAQYHLERSSDTVIALGDGTDESNTKMQNALNRLWPFAGEMFVDDDVDREIADKQIAPLPSTMKECWDGKIQAVFKEACLTAPSDEFAHQGGKNGKRHTEHLGHMLATMQVLQRSHPNAVW